MESFLASFLGKEGIKLRGNYIEYKVQQYAMMIEMYISSGKWRILETMAALQRVEKYLMGIISQWFLLIKKGY